MSQTKHSPRRHEGEFIDGDEYFLGCIPYPWIQLAASISHCAAYVGVTLWRESLSGRVPVTLTAEICRNYRLPRRTVQRLLQRLEDNGLVLVERRKSQPP
jgi:DNA-binding transcriptional ArsR family regulator